MSNYKVGDLAALFPSSENKLQSLFYEHYKKRQTTPNSRENKKLEENTSSEIMVKSKTSKKEKKRKISTNEDFPTGKNFSSSVVSFSKDYSDESPQKKKQKKNKPELAPTSIKSSKKELKTAKKESVDVPELFHVKEKKLESNSAFIRSSKKKSKTVQQEDVKDFKLFHVPKEENIFNEDSDSESMSDDAPKKLKSKPKSKQPSFKHDMLTEATEEQDSSQKDVKMNAEQIRLENMRDLPNTLFVGNLPTSVNRRILQKLFQPFGPIKTVRLRGAVPTKLTIPKKVAEIKSEYHEGLHSLSGFVVFIDRESAERAISLNGTLFEGHHIVVDFANQAGQKKLYDNNSSIFIGNLPFKVDDESVRAAFEECGEIHAIRIVRDKNTGLGKGFGYVQFQNSLSKERALALKEVEIEERQIRIKPIDQNQTGNKPGAKKSLMMIRNNVAKSRTHASGGRKSVKKLLKKGKQIHQKKKIARLFGQKFVK